MRYVKLAIIVIVGVPLALGLHWALPSRDIVQIVGVEVKRMERGGLLATETETGTRLSRDVRIVQALWPGGDSRVYRNEDTDFGFPFYFKFDSGDVQADATGSISTRDDPRWVVVRHYGWRLDFLSMYPNVLSIRDAKGLDEPLWPWFNIIFLGGLAVGLVTLWRLAQMMWRTHVDPVVAEIEAETAGAWGRFRRWLGRLLGG